MSESRNKSNRAVVSKVLKISKQYQHFIIKTEFIIKYEGEPDSDWCLSLLDDMEKDDLIIDE